MWTTVGGVVASDTANLLAFDQRQANDKHDYSSAESFEMNVQKTDITQPDYIGFFRHKNISVKLAVISGVQLCWFFYFF
jgi:hypothetical protein